jgi:hypothetical protein
MTSLSGYKNKVNRFQDPDGICFTVFPNERAPSCRVLTQPGLAGLEASVRRTTAASKPQLPLVKFARFSGEPSDHGCLRYDAAIIGLTGFMGDYDAGELPLTTAGERLRQAGVEALFYASPSATPTFHKWRVCCPASHEYAGTPDELKALHTKWAARVNGALAGVLAGESFGASQSYFIGTIEGQPARATLITKGARIDLLDSLDAGAIGKNGRAERTHRTEHAPPPDDLEESDDAPELMAEGRSRVANYVRKSGQGTQPQGSRVFQLVGWLGDMRYGGLILSAEAIAELIEDACPMTRLADIEDMLARRRNERGCELIGRLQDPAMDDVAGDAAPEETPNGETTMPPAEDPLMAKVSREELRRERKAFRASKAERKAARAGQASTGAWRFVEPDEVFPPGCSYRMDQTTGRREVWEDRPNGDAASRPKGSRDRTAQQKAEAQPTERRRRFQGYTPEEGAALPDLEFWDKPEGSRGLLPRSPEGTVIVLSGIYGSHKTNLVLTLLLDAILQKDARVCYSAGEGIHGVCRRRVPAHCEARGIKPADLNGKLTLVPEIPLLANTADVKDFIQEQKTGLKPNIIVLDTLATATAGQDENTALMSSLLTANGPVGRISREFKALVVVLAHQGKDPDKGIRGHSGLSGNIDAGLIATSDKKHGIIQLFVDKMRDGPDKFAVYYRFDPDDDVIPVPRRITETEAQAAGWTSPAESKKAKATDTVFDALHTMGSTGATYGEWQKASTKADTSFRRCRQTLIAEGRVVERDGRYFCADKAPEPALRKAQPRKTPRHERTE